HLPTHLPSRGLEMQGESQTKREDATRQLASREPQQAAADPDSEACADDSSDIVSSRARRLEPGRRAVRATIVRRPLGPGLQGCQSGHDVRGDPPARPGGDRTSDAEIETRGWAHSLDERTPIRK